MGDETGSEVHDFLESASTNDNPIVRRRSWLLWSLTIVWLYALAYACLCVVLLGFISPSQDDYAAANVALVLLFPIGEFALFIAYGLRGLLNLGGDPVVASLVASIPVFVLAIPMGAFQGVVLAGLVRLSVVTRRRLASRGAATARR